MAPKVKRRGKRLRNVEIAQKLEAIADMLAMQSANPFRIRAYQNAARTLRGLGVEVIDMIARGENLADLESVAEDLAGKIKDFATTGTTRLYEQLRAKTPDLAFALIEIPGLGPKRVQTLIKGLRAKTIADIRRAAHAEKVRELEGFGPKTEAELLQALEKAPSPRRRPIATVEPEAAALVAHMKAARSVKEAVVAGSFRRARESVGDLDMVVSATAGASVVEHFKDYAGVADIVGAGTTRATVVLRDGLQVDMRVVKPESYGAALLYFTGSKAHVVALRALVRARGMKLNEYGLYRGKKRLAGATEAEVYAALALDFMPPELREATGEIEAARKHALPDLVDLAAIKGDLCVRCAGPIAPVAEKARGLGYAYVAFVTRLADVDAAGLRKRRAEIEKAQTGMPGIRLLHAIEVDIAEDGDLAAPDGALDKADFVVGAVNTSLNLPHAQQSDRLALALAHPRLAMLAHPTGRIIGRREPIDVDWPRILRVAAQEGVALQLSGDPERLDLTDVHCRLARDADALIAIGTDARTPAELERMALAVQQARRGWLEPGHVLNTMSASKALTRLQAAHGSGRAGPARRAASRR